MRYLLHANYTLIKLAKKNQTEKKVYLEFDCLKGLWEYTQNPK